MTFGSPLGDCVTLGKWSSPPNLNSCSYNTPSFPGLLSESGHHTHKAKHSAWHKKCTRQAQETLVTSTEALLFLNVQRHKRHSMQSESVTHLIRSTTRCTLLPHFTDEEIRAQGHRTKWQSLNLNPRESGCRIYALSHYVMLPLLSSDI